MGKRTSSWRYIRIEYDPDHSGGDNSGVRSYVNIHESMIKLGEGFEDSVRSAFRKSTNLDPVCITHYSDKLLPTDDN